MKKKLLRAAVWVALGALAGYLYYARVGCLTGTCAITGNPVNSTIWGAVMGYLLSVIFERKPKVHSEEEPGEQQSEPTSSLH